MGEKAQVRHQKKMARLIAVADAYERAVYAGSHTPALDVGKRFDATRVAVRTWIFQARLAGLIVDSEHRPRQVDWGQDSWTACRQCRATWPCAEAVVERDRRMGGAS